MALQFFALLSLAYHVGANDAYGTSMFPRSRNVPVFNFTYDTITGPSGWYQSNPNVNAACEKGTHQSPVVINNANANPASVASSNFKWTVNNYPNGTSFENVGTTVDIVVNGTLTDMIANKAYRLVQAHFHTPSEHRIDHEYFPMEMHWVHESYDRQIAVIGFLIELCEGQNCGDGVLESLFSSINKIATPGTAVQSAPLDFSQLMTKFKANDVYRYSGSLTTPPCTEGVNWLISKARLYVDLETFLAVKAVVNFNSRFTQRAL